jgi:disulfide bond formation protein DsbB
MSSMPSRAGSSVDERIDPHLFDELQRAVTLALVGWLALAVLAVLAVVLVALGARRARRHARFRARHHIRG